MPIVIPSGSTPTAAMESLVLDGLALNDESIFVLEAFAFNPAPKRQRWIQGEDADGSALAEPSRSENATATMTLRVVPQGTMDSALAQIGKIADKLYEAEQQPDGIPLVWTPATGTKTATAYVLSGEITDLPFTPESGYWVLAPLLTVRFDCKPFMYGAEVTSAATVTNANPYQILTVAGVTGDVPAEARLVVTDAASQIRRFLRWGRRWRYYDAAASLYVDSDNMVTTGFMGVQATRAGAHDPGASGNTVVRTVLTPASTPLACCGLGNLGHVGNYLAVLRCYTSVAVATRPEDVKVRLAWKEGDGPLRGNGWVSPAVVNNFTEIELGVVSIPPKTLGTQRWTGQIEAYSPTSADLFEVDYVLLYPTDGYGKARVVTRPATPTTVSGRDEFDQTAGALAGKTAAVGGVWAGVGTVGGADLTVDATAHNVQRTTAVADATIGRGATVPQTMTNTVVQIDVTSGATASNSVQPSVMARYVDESNFAQLVVVYVGATLFSVTLLVYVSGALTILDQQFPNTPITTTSAHTLRMQVDDAGSASAWFGDTGSLAGLPPTLTGSHPSLAAGGALASGKPGFRDAMGSVGSVTRAYDNFVAASFASDAVIYSGRAAEINSEKAERADSTGTYYGPVQPYRGARFFLEPAGDENRINEVVVAAKRNDVESQADDQIADSTTATIHYTPRWSTVPR